MRKPGWVFDARSIVDEKKVIKIKKFENIILRWETKIKRANTYLKKYKTKLKRLKKLN